MRSQICRTYNYEKYKAIRVDLLEDLISHFDIVKEAIDIFNNTNVGIENYEAYDIIDNLARKYQNEVEVIILTGDLDMLQLVDDNISVAIMRKGLGNYEVFNKINFLEKKGILPEQIVKFIVLTGDSADNYQ